MIQNHAEDFPNVLEEDRHSTLKMNANIKAVTRLLKPMRPKHLHGSHKVIDKQQLDKNVSLSSLIVRSDREVF